MSCKSHNHKRHVNKDGDTFDQLQFYWINFQSMSTIESWKGKKY